MPKQQTLIFTALPNGRTENGKLRLSVAIAIELRDAEKAAQGDVLLENFPDAVLWAQTARNLRCSVEFRQDKNAPIVIAPPNVAREMAEKKMPSQSYWEQIFPKTMLVAPYAPPTDLKAQPIISYATMNLANVIESSYASAAVNYANKTLRGSELVKQFGDASLYQKTSSPSNFSLGGGDLGNLTTTAFKKAGNVALKQTAVTHLQTMVAELEKDKFIKSYTADMAKDFARVKLFTELTKPSQNFKYDPKLEKQRLQTELDFHGAQSAVGNYGDLMRLLGLAMDLIIELPQDVEKTLNTATPLSVRVLPDAQSIAGKFIALTMRTAVRLSPTDFRAARQVESNGTLTGNRAQGFLNLADKKQFDLVQFDVEGATMKLMNLVENYEAHHGSGEAEPVPLASAENDAELLAAAMPQLNSPVVRETPQKTGVPFLQTTGVSIVRIGRAEEARREIARNLGTAQTNDGIVQRLEAARNSATTQTPVVPDVLLYAEDLTKGFRIDVWDAEKKKWFSLCKRDGTYNLTKSGTTLNFSDEGMIESSHAGHDLTDGKKTVRINSVLESLCKWDGWSLAAPRPGKVVDEKDTAVELKNKSVQGDPKMPIGLDVNFTATKGTLPKLRFGKIYRFRARAVDLACNSLALDDITNFEAATDELLYVRYEPVVSPTVLLRATLKPAESIDYMVIRSNFDKSAAQYAADKKDIFPNERHVVAPQQAQLMCERHGKFDNVPPAESYQLITSREGALSKSNPLVKKDRTKEPQVSRSDESPRFRVKDGKSKSDSGFRLFEKDSETFDYTKTIFPEESIVTLPYLPDPLADAVAFALIDRFGNAVGAVQKMPLFTSGGVWHSPLSLRLRLIEGEKLEWKPLESDGKNIITLQLPKAEIATIRISSIVRQADFEKLGMRKVMQTRQPKFAKETDKDLLEGKFWWVQPYREIKVAHPVQQPLKVGEFKKFIAQRFLGNTAAYLNGIIELDDKSTMKLDLDAEWTETIDDEVPNKEPFTRTGKATIGKVDINYGMANLIIGRQDLAAQKAGGYTVNVNKSDAPSISAQTKVQLDNDNIKNLLVKEQTLSDMSYKGSKKGSQPIELSQNLAQAFSIAEQFEAFGNLVDMSSEVNKIKFAPSPIVSDMFEGLNTVFNFETLPAFKHEFGDTKHRQVTYKSVVTTRFREYYLDLLYKDVNNKNGSVRQERTDLPLTRESTVSVNILSTARPAAPKPMYIVPLFTWEQEEDGKTVLRRRCGCGLRVFLERPWYSSGDGELLGIVIAKDDAQYEQQAMQPYLTRWGLDPIWKSSGDLKVRPTIGDFKSATRAQKNVALPERSRVEYQPMFNSQGKMISNEAMIVGDTVDVVGHPVVFDKERNCYFSDVVIDPGASYFPFIRLALARYQPNSVPDCYLSQTVMTDFIQLVPDRAAAVSIDTSRGAAVLQVKVGGVYALNNENKNASTQQSVNEIRKSQRFVVSLEERKSDTEFGWSSLGIGLNNSPESEMGVQRVENSRALWIDGIPADKTKVVIDGIKQGRKYRVVVKEYERVTPGDDQERLVYADVIPLDSLTF